jgi:hypothetical protein
MKIKLTSTLVLSSLVAATNANVTPYRISLESLLSASPLQDDSSFMNALTTTGMIAVTSLPDSVKDAARTMLSTQHQCLIASSHTQEQTYADGTVRVTLATHTVAGRGGMQGLNHKTDNSLEECVRFKKATKVFRAMTQIVVAAFAAQITMLVKVTNGPLLVTEGEEEDLSYAFQTFADVVENGEHLEHFHSYLKASERNDVVNTINLHVDQGLFLAFTPGRLSSGELTNGFFIQTMDGAIEQVDFLDSDDLVFMLGDGVNQYVNNKIHGSKNKLRAVPHAVQLESSEYARIWYGLMVLPPSSALHPAYGVSFGAIRQGLVAGDEHAIRLACTRTDSISRQRVLAGEGTTCENADAIYCWHRCMNLTDFGVSEEFCAASSRQLRCINPRGQLSTGDKAGEYFPGCASSDL